MKNHRVSVEHNGSEMQLSGGWTLDNVSSLVQPMYHALQEQDALLLDLSQVSACDIAFIQFLVATIKEAQATDRSVRLVGTPPSCLTQCAAELGLDLHKLGVLQRDE